MTLRRLVAPGFVLAAGWFAFQYWIIFNPQPPLFARPLHVVFALALVLLARPLAAPGERRWPWLTIDGLLLLGVAATTLYYLVAFPRLSTRMENVSPVLWQDVVFGVLFLVVLLECVRRVVGWSLLGVILAFLAYGAFGPWFPGWLRFQGFGGEEAIEILTMTTAGVLGITTETSLNFVFYFVAFGAVYAAIGGGQLFIDAGLRVAGRQQGGAAKAAVLSSSLMGCISGSAVANVTATGVFTIPLMRRCGLSPERAAATEAIASTGGQLMPPIMGIAAFVMAELLVVPYGRIALAGLIPALAFYLALLVAVDLDARRSGIGTLGPADLDGIPPLLPRLHLLIPPLVLLGLLIGGHSATYAAVMATASCLVVAFLRRATWLTWQDLVSLVASGARQAAEVAVPIAAIGIIIAVAIQSNLALKFSTNLIAVSGGTLIGAMVFIILGCIVMGMGLPTVAAYIIGAVLFVPTLKELGIADLAAHFFVMYYCVLSMVTPPVALASYAAAGLAGGNAFRTSLGAFRLGLMAFFVPFAFAFDPALLFEGPPAMVLLASIVLMVGTAAWAVALTGHLNRRLDWSERALFAVSSVTLVFAPTATPWWVVAFVCVLGVFAWSYFGHARLLGALARPARRLGR